MQAAEVALVCITQSQPRRAADQARRWSLPTDPARRAHGGPAAFVRRNTSLAGRCNGSCSVLAADKCQRPQIDLAHPEDGLDSTGNKVGELALNQSIQAAAYDGALDRCIASLAGGYERL